MTPTTGVDSPSEQPRVRCWDTTDPLYQAYHDDEWGVPVREETRLYERITLEAFQSGLSWITILRKRDAFRAAFAGFDPVVVARFGPDDVDRLLQDTSIIRNRAKIEATLTNARALVALHASGRTLVEILTRHAPPARDQPWATVDDVPGRTPESTALAKELKALGFRFIGPTTAYSTLQACGFVDDHVATCWLNGDGGRRR